MRSPCPGRARHWTPLVAAMFALAACSPSAGHEDASAGGVPEPEGWPRTVAHAHGEIALDAAPERVVALSSDAADAALQLAGPERLAAVPDLNRDPHQSLQHEAAAQVEGVIDTAAEADAESVLAYEPDLVVVTERHDAESLALGQLEQAGVPVLPIANTWDSPELYVENLRLIGEALGTEERAEELAGDYERRWEDVEARVADLPEDERPRTALLRIIAGQVFYSGPGAISQPVLSAAGASHAAEEIGLERSQPASVEQLSASAPDRIVLLDSTGAGEAQFAELLDSPGIGAVPAVAEEQILILTAAQLSSGSGGIEALEEIAAWLHPDLF